MKYQPGYTDQFTHRYFYDAENRLTEVQTSLDGFTWEKEARYEYYLHGPLARTTIGQQQVQGVDYAYTLHGWLKGMNSTGATATHDIGGDGKAGGINQYVGRDALGFTLNYFHGDYKPVNVGVTPFPSYRVPGSGLLDRDYRPLYNGNISSMAYNIRMFEQQGHSTVFANYRYDQLNRYVGQDNFFRFDKASNSYTGTWDSVYTYKERVSYDANGNIQNYTRHNINPGGALMDELGYKYYPGTNQLRQVTDQVADNAYGNSWDVIFDIDNQADTSNYVYDAIGNLIADKAEKITGIKWNVYGKIAEITRNPAITDMNTTFRMRYTYDAQGNRIGKVQKWYNKDSARYENRYTWYVRDAQGNLLSTYASATFDTTGANLQALGLIQNDVQIYGSSRLGSLFPLNSQAEGANNTGPYINPDYRGTTFYRGHRQYELSNHLGNVLTIITDRKRSVSSNGSLTDYYEPDMVAANDYYPFGMLSRTIAGPGGPDKQYKFGFNGKENDNEVKGLGSQQDYGMRIYDPRVGRFLSVDPLTKTYPWYTPYQFAGNKPIWATDVDGLEENTSSTYVYHPPVLGLRPTFAGVISITDATTQRVHKTFSGNFAQLKKGDAVGLGTAIVYQFAALNAGTPTSSLDITMTGTRSQVSKTWEGTDIKYFTQYSYSFTNNNITEIGTFEMQTGKIQASMRAWDPLVFLLVNKVISSVVQASVVTSFGRAIQSTAAEALQASKKVFNGTRLYRLGTTGKSATGADAQFWSLENPLTMSAEAYAKKYGIPLKNVQNADFVETAILKDGAKYITREAPIAPGAPAGAGGGIEAVVEKGGTAANVITPIKR